MLFFNGVEHGPHDHDSWCNAKKDQTVNKSKRTLFGVISLALLLCGVVALSFANSDFSMRVRFAAPNAVVQMRLEAYNEVGLKVFDTEQHGGNVLDWHLQSAEGDRVPEGVYLCIVSRSKLFPAASARSWAM